MDPVTTAEPAPDAGQTPAAPAPDAGQSQTIPTAQLAVETSKAASKLTLMTLANDGKITAAIVKGLLPADANVIAQDLLRQSLSVPKELAKLCEKKALASYRADRKDYLRANSGAIAGAMLDEGAFIEKLTPWRTLKNGDEVRSLTQRKPHVKTILVTKTAELIETIKRARIAQMSEADRAELEMAMKGLNTRAAASVPVKSDAVDVVSTVIPAPLAKREI